jgi:cytochrome c551/c552
LNQQKIGPPLSAWKEVADPAAWIRQMWNHSGAMYAKAKEKKIPWPNLSGQDFSDLLVYLRRIPQTRSAEARFTVYDPGQGKTLFESKGCTRCHVIKGVETGKISIPIAGHPADNLSAVAATMWNHAPIMNTNAHGDLPRFEGDEMNHVLGYLFWAGFFDEAGDPNSGQRVYEKKGCVDCHSKGEAGAPSLATIRAVPGGASSVTMTSALWHHGPAMLAAMKQRGRQWPQFTPREMADLIAFLNRRD